MCASINKIRLSHTVYDCDDNFLLVLEPTRNKLYLKVHSARDSRNAAFEFPASTNQQAEF